ncbi:MAG: pilus assembly protein TadG-related protein [Actinomycetes bacterium]
MEDSVSSKCRSEIGSISGFVVVLSMTFVACAGLAFDGGRVISARAKATDAAENAARAGAQQVTSLRSGNPNIDEDSAITAAHQFLESMGITGLVKVDKNSVTVTTRIKVPMTLLGLFGITEKSVSSVRSAQPFTSP